MPSILEQYRVSDFLEWYREQKLELNPDFQRGSVWTPAARGYLIDTILRQLPVPKIYLRTKIDVLTKRSVREVVDGQQRLRAILDFGNDQFVLSKRAGEFAGFKYSTLPSDLQQVFLSYPLAVDQLLNASDDDVLEVFARLNSYSVQLNSAEKRHASYQGEFKWAVREASRRWSVLWDRFHVIGVRQRVRMEDDSLMAEMFGVILDGVTDGGQTNVDKIYKEYDDKFDPQGEVPKRVDDVLSFFVETLGDFLRDSPILNGPHFLMLFSALAHAIHGIPPGDMDDDFPVRSPDTLTDLGAARNNLLQLSSIIGAGDLPNGYEDFWRASKASTQRIASRRVRFPYFYRALSPQPI